MVIVQKLLYVKEERRMEKQRLKREMTSGQMTMVGLGALIGTGLFLNSAYTIKNAGPGGAILCYLFGGLVMWSVMVCLGELAVAIPKAGSFQEYSTRLIGHWFGHAIGWLYWFSWVLCIAWYLSASGMYMQYWLPDTPVWIWSILFGIALFIFNNRAARKFGTGQFWFAGIKVFAILIFILICIGRLLGIGGPSPGFSNLVDHGGFFPVGLVAILPVMMSVVFAYQGTEVMATTAEEAEDPNKAIPRAINSTIFQTLALYLVSIFVIMLCIPWTAINIDESPFVTVLKTFGISGADHIMNFIILVAALSAANSAVYTCTRFLFGLGERNGAPKFVTELNKDSIPFNALVLTTVGIIICLLTDQIPVLASTVNVWMWAVSGVIGSIAWIVIGMDVIFLRRQMAREGKSIDSLPYRSPSYPFVPILAIVLNLIVLFSMLMAPDQRLSLYLGIPIVILTFVCFYIREKAMISSGKFNAGA